MTSLRVLLDRSPRELSEQELSEFAFRFSVCVAVGHDVGYIVGYNPDHPRPFNVNIHIPTEKVGTDVRASFAELTILGVLDSA